MYFKRVILGGPMLELDNLRPIVTPCHIDDYFVAKVCDSPFSLVFFSHTLPQFLFTFKQILFFHFMLLNPLIDQCLQLPCDSRVHVVLHQLKQIRTKLIRYIIALGLEFCLNASDQCRVLFNHSGDHRVHSQQFIVHNILQLY